MDDTNLQVTENTVYPAITLVLALQDLAQLWFVLLEATGGTLGHNMCRCAKAEHAFVNGRRMYAPMTNEKLVLQTTQGPVEIQQFATTQGICDTGM